MKLYKATITAYIVSSDEDMAMWETRVGHIDVSCCDIEIEEACNVPSRWADSFPFGENARMSCQEYIDGVQK